jgi:hypothetical protein
MVDIATRFAPWVHAVRIRFAFQLLTVRQKEVSRGRDHLLWGNKVLFRDLSMFVAFLVLALVPALAGAQDVDPSQIRRRLGGCSNTYRCPKYSYPKPGRGCYKDFDDCDCNAGYHKEGYYCVEDYDDNDNSGGDNNDCDSRYECPYPYWKPKDGVRCVYDMDDCECGYGYKLVSGCCVELSCKFDYRCPPYSKRRLYRKCYRDISDCVCDSGYMKWRNKCIKKKYW